jgi:YD repeat-containing protein
VQLAPDGASLSVARDGTVLFWSNGQILSVTPDGVLHAITGARGDTLTPLAQGLALASAYLGSTPVFEGPDARIHFLSIDALGRHHVMRSAGITSTILSGGESYIADPDGARLHVFTPAGRHVRTLDALTLAALQIMHYDAAGRLVGLEDRDGNLTTIERAADGLPTAIVGPYGHRTSLTTDAQSYLASVVDPAGAAVQLAHDSSGLLTDYVDPRGGARHYTYDHGRLVTDQDAAGATITLTRAAGTDTSTVTLTTGAGLSSASGLVQGTASGDIWRSIDPTGSKTRTEMHRDNSQRSALPDGSSITLTTAPDPRFGATAPLTATEVVSTPSGLSSMVSRARTAILGSSSVAIARQTDTVTINGATFTDTYDDAQHTRTLSTPLGRTLTLTYDAAGHLSTVAPPGLTPTTYTYDARGRVVALTQGPRSRRSPMTPSARSPRSPIRSATNSSTNTTRSAVSQA